MPNYIATKEYDLQLSYIVDFIVDACLFADLIETNIVPYTLEDIQKFVERRDRRILQYFEQINEEYFIRFFTVTNYDDIIGQQKLLLWYSTLPSPSDYFYIYMPIENLDFFIQKYNLEERQVDTI